MKALVTGGGGFLGQYIVEQLVARGDQVRSLSRKTYPALDALGVEQTAGDIQDGDIVDSACTNIDVVFHTAAIAGIWGDPKTFFWHQLARHAEYHFCLQKTQRAKTGFQ